MNWRIIHFFLFSFLFGLLLLPLIQRKFNFIPQQPLDGDFIPAKKKKFTMAGWFDADFQNDYNKYFEENIGFRNSLIRIYNQVDFSFFNTTHSDVVVGNNGCLFQQSYLDSYTGKDFIGTDKIKEQVQKIKFVQEKLKEKGILLVIAFAPSKVRFYQDLIPSYYSGRATTNTNYSAYIKAMSETHVPALDFIDYFGRIKDTASYALYPKQGIHWSQYGMYLVADSILKFLRKEGMNLNNLYCGGIEMTDQLRSTDYDLGNLCNVWFNMPHDDMPYPVLRSENNPANQRPNTLVIGDSYYWNIYYSEIPENIFSGRNFWYYNNEVYVDSLQPLQARDPLRNIQYDSGFSSGVLLKRPEFKVPFLPLRLKENRFSQNSVDQAFAETCLRNIYFSETMQKIFSGVKTWYYRDEERDKKLVKHSLDISGHLQTIEKQQVIIVLQTEINLNKLGFGFFNFVYDKYNNQENIVASYEKLIRSNPEWLQAVRKKAENRKMSLDQIISEDARWMVEQERVKKK